MVIAVLKGASITPGASTWLTWGSRICGWHHWQNIKTREMQLSFPHLCESILLRRLEVFGHQQPNVTKKMWAEKDIPKCHMMWPSIGTNERFKGKISSICPVFFWRLPVEYTSLLENLKSKFRQEAISAQHPGVVCCLHFGPSMPHFSSNESDTSWLLQKKWTFWNPIN